MKKRYIPVLALEQDNFEIASMGEEVDPHFRPPSKIESDAAGRLPCVDTLTSTRRLLWTLASLLRMAQGSSLAQGSALAARVPGPVISRAPPALGTPWHHQAGTAPPAMRTTAALPPLPRSKGAPLRPSGWGAAGGATQGRSGCSTSCLPPSLFSQCWLGTLILSGLLLRPGVAPHTQYTP